MIKKVTTVELVTGDRVLVRNLTPRVGPSKLRSCWEQKIYPVLSKKGGTQSYEVTSELGKERVAFSIVTCSCSVMNYPLKRLQGMLFITGTKFESTGSK